jgi:hypothetical protein
MVSRGRRDQIQRRAPSRDPKRRILIVCEGRETEPGYFKALRDHARNRLVHVQIAKETGVPLTVVQIAIRLRNEALVESKAQRDENLRFDDVWGVFDVDDHPGLKQALALAKAENIEVAMSNPCFELWALLHFQEQNAHLSRQKARAKLQVHLPGYDKKLNFNRLKPHHEEAMKRAERLWSAALRDEQPDRNPTTGVYRLAGSIVRP